MKIIKLWGNIKFIECCIVLFLFSIKIIPQFQYTFAGLKWSLGYQILFIIWFF